MALMDFGISSEGYFIHTSEWRRLYGPGMQFPHYDKHNDNSESRNGSHGCINLPPRPGAMVLPAGHRRQYCHRLLK